MRPGPGEAQFIGKFTAKLYIFGPRPGEAQFTDKFKGKLSISGLGRERPHLEVSLKETCTFWGPGPGEAQFKGKFKGKLYILRPGPGEA